VKVARPGAGSVRGLFAGFLGLVALHAVASQGGSGRVASAFADVAGVIERVLNPTVPAIPDRRNAVPVGTAMNRAAASAATAGARISDRLPINPAPFE
jgi:hypothetical protein